MANHLTIERLGGLAGFGGPSAKIRSRGRVDLDQLSAETRAAIESLFAQYRGAPTEPASDAFRYRLSRPAGGKVETIEVSEGSVPPVITSALDDELV